MNRRRLVPGGQPARRIAEVLFPDARIHHVASWPAIADVFDALDDQRPATCGAYATRYLLGPLGHPRHDGVETTREDYLAHIAGTVIETEELAEVAAARATVAELGLDDAAAIGRFPRTWYGWPVRSSDDDVITGTSPTGTARAIAVASDGALVTLPVPARRLDGSVALSTERFAALLDLVEANLETWDVHPIANLEVDQLLDATSEAYGPATLTGPDPDAAIPREAWGVGHFVGIGAFWRAADDRRWVLLLDTYKARGFDGYVPQPAESLRKAIVREDGREGGLLLVLPRAVLDEAEAAVANLGLEVRMWGNGSLEPEGWTWALGR